MAKVLAAASGGGHWEQLMLLRETLDRFEATYAVTDPALAEQRGIEDAAILPDCNLDRPIAAAHCALVALWLIVKGRPDRVISTGAAPGFFCILFGRMIGARTLWIDSVANAEQLSMCGRLSMKIAHECLTQWKHLSSDEGPQYKGSVL